MALPFCLETSQIRIKVQNFPGGPVAKTPCSQCRWLGLSLVRELDPTCREERSCMLQGNRNTTCHNEDPVQPNIIKNKLFLSFIYLFLASLGLCCCSLAFSSCSERRLLFIVVDRLLIAEASCCRQWALEHMGLIVVAHGAYSPLCM